MANPANFFAIDDIKFITGHEVEVLVATEAAVKRAIDRLYDNAESMADVMKSMEGDELEVVETERRRCRAPAPAATRPRWSSSSTR